ncbi:MAG: ribonuclease III [Phycisphaerae bacterium]|nr:ribonuclease III [Phycisphaerae bacterium]
MPVDESTLTHFQELVGYGFSRPELLELALTHASVAPSRVQSNERLEFLGDAVLELVVCEELYATYPDLLEGDMTKAKSVVVSRETCAEIARAIGICELLETGKGMAREERLPMSVAAAVFEAIVGAMYLDGGAAPVRAFILSHVRPRIERALASQHQRNFKSLLQQHAQRRLGGTPEYCLLDEKGPDHSKCFEVAVRVNGRSFPSAWGNNKKEAEQKAARRALTELDVL